MEDEKNQRINDVDEELIEEASAFTVVRKKRWKVFLPIAALALLIMGALFGLYYNSNKVELDENGKIDIYTIKGAQIIEDAPETGFEFRELGEPGPPEEYVELHRDWIKNEGEVFIYGTAKNLKMVTIEDYVHSKGVSRVEEDGTRVIEEEEFPATWWIMAFDIDVIDDMQILDGIETIHVVSACRYTTEAKFTGPFILENPTEMKKMLTELQSNPTGLFILKNQTLESEKEKVWEIKGREYEAVDFADYIVKMRYDCDGEKFQYSSMSPLYTVYLDELRVQKEE